MLALAESERLVLVDLLNDVLALAESERLVLVDALCEFTVLVDALCEFDVLVESVTVTFWPLKKFVPPVTDVEYGLNVKEVSPLELIGTVQVVVKPYPCLAWNPFIW